MPERQTRAAVVQAATVFGDAKATVEKARAFAAKARAEGAQLVVFPEAFVGVYPKGADFHIFIGARTPEGRDEFRAYYEGAIDVPGDEVSALGAVARDHGLFVVVGVVERERGTHYCSVLFFGPDGSFLGKHRKLMPTAAERFVWGFGDGSTLTTIDTPWGCLGSVICWENYMPMLRMAMYQKNVALYCAPTADDRDTWAGTMQHVALEGRCFVLSACQYLQRSDLPADMRNALAQDGNAVLMRGGSLIVNPLGRILAGPSFAGECVLTADLDLDDIARGKFDFDVVGHYARPDVFQLHVNEAPACAVVSAVLPVDRPERS